MWFTVDGPHGSGKTEVIKRLGTKGFIAVNEYSSFDFKNKRRIISPFPPTDKGHCIEGVIFFSDLEKVRQDYAREYSARNIVFERSFIAVLSFLYATRKSGFVSCLKEATKYYYELFRLGYLIAPEKMVLLKFSNENIFNERLKEKAGSLPFFLSWHNTLTVQEFLQVLAQSSPKGSVLLLEAEDSIDDNTKQIVSFLSQTSPVDWVTETLNKLLDK